MDSPTDSEKEEKLKSLLGRLEVECGIFERIIYKNKNQHRRSSYFQYLLKVRRDLRLLKSAHLEELLNSCFLVITGKRPKQKVQLLESLKRRKYDVGKPNFMERLLGAARLLSQMVEPMLRAATQVSTLAARSFFMGFSITVLSLLARLRVLVQQILLDVIPVFNTVSSLSQTKNSVKLNQQGIEIFREFYPKKEDYVTLECVWNTDKFILVERTNTCETEIQEEDNDGEVPVGGNEVLYKTIESVLGDDKPTAENADTEISPHMNETTTNFIRDHDDKDTKQVENFAEKADDTVVTENPWQKTVSQASSLADTGTAGSSSLKLVSNVRKVAFVPVKRPATSTGNPTDVPSKESKSNGGDKTEVFYSLLTRGNLNDSLFG
ncbi:putative sgp1 monomeric G-protein [Hibiscus syriacus]|uniref:Sgp1 monomeric G-protein n=1 Tax=Hibiscus syriacus TaxID=106335 RepID=A0A6A2Y831_HIBSY|nr:uncharacterized protein LOC120179434 [Hibiscus syriacus]KAE8667327.1 putative sgp1 monomeric G-protein [Hibiscus syriacus]